MSETKFTPGPWEYGADVCPDNEAALAICKENIDAHTQPSSGHFFVVYLEDGRRTALVGHGPDGYANARLIAAAPDLYHALLQLLDDTTGPGEIWAPGTAVENARDAIAKATGVQR